ncbi:hypothetical protein [Priestia megaterium]|uniref:hypothetical protein n=1 Tax=Priestia megaterium TaxID=1404 RepID=UPI003009302A
MKLHLMENGIDSLKFGIDFYQKYLRLPNKYHDENPGYLKMAVISIHNAIELFSKQLLIDVNEVLIYKNLDSNVLLKVLAEQRNEREEGLKDTPIDWSLVTMNADVHTIDYNVCITRLKTIFELTKQQYHTLKELSILRNQLTHFGIDRTIDFHEILLVINDSLKLIDLFYHNHLETDDAYYYLNQLHENDLFESVIEEAQVILEQHWAAYYSDNFVDINHTMQEIESDSDFFKILQSKHLDIDIELGDHSDSQNVTLRINSDQTDFDLQLTTYHSPKNDITIFIDEDTELMHFFINHEKLLLEKDKPLYIYKKPKDYTDELDNDTDYWESVKNHQKNNDCIKKDFNKSEIASALLDIVNNK